jgi:hypothetical protein
MEERWEREQSAVRDGSEAKVDRRRGNHRADTSHELYLIIHTQTHAYIHRTRERERDVKENIKCTVERVCKGKVVSVYFHPIFNCASPPL